ncbi:hypothetical protein ASPBRDRAFT_499680 [Aspergillus brasiliensis CBS 101740]|uniref:Uncharacterized protein n=1 Tax=Aspergillus brasiliensis (strain CBS 101740 / IMI 381727 / IBT 21946) TaxID=767769 RepID=A0A1L9UNP4_ASPBC|nr:hypothetical protein ASPBRDRAFT_499680 [Aspergillus brasiliensis CBS 101740]
MSGQAVERNQSHNCVIWESIPVVLLMFGGARQGFESFQRSSCFQRCLPLRDLLPHVPRCPSALTLMIDSVFLLFVMLALPTNKSLIGYRVAIVKCYIRVKINKVHFEKQEAVHKAFR